MILWSHLLEFLLVFNLFSGLRKKNVAMRMIRFCSCSDAKFRTLDDSKFLCQATACIEIASAFQAVNPVWLWPIGVLLWKRQLYYICSQAGFFVLSSILNVFPYEIMAIRLFCWIFVLEASSFIYVALLRVGIGSDTSISISIFVLCDEYRYRYRCSLYVKIYIYNCFI